MDVLVVCLCIVMRRRGDDEESKIRSLKWIATDSNYITTLQLCAGGGACTPKVDTPVYFAPISLHELSVRGYIGVIIAFWAPFLPFLWIAIDIILSSCISPKCGPCYDIIFTIVQMGLPHARWSKLVSMSRSIIFIPCCSPWSVRRKKCAMEKH